MPAYSFVCAGCGPFEVTRSIELAGDPQCCTNCGSVARRVFAAPSVRRTPSALRRARDGEERSAHEPRVVSRPMGAPLPAGVGHGHSH